MAELKEYERIAIKRKAIQWDGLNETYEIIAGILPNKFEYRRPSGDLKTMYSLNARQQVIKNGEWLVIDETSKYYEIMDNDTFIANYQEYIPEEPEEPVATGVETATFRGFNV